LRATAANYTGFASAKKAPAVVHLDLSSRPAFWRLNRTFVVICQHSIRFCALGFGTAVALVWKSLDDDHRRRHSPTTAPRAEKRSARSFDMDFTVVLQTLLVTPDLSRNRVNLQVVRIGSFGSDAFEWNGKRWRVRFQSWPRKPQEVDPRLYLWDVFPEDHPDFQQGGSPLWKPTMSLEEKIASMEAFEITREAIRQNGTGWHLRLSGDGVEGWFDLAKLPKEPSDKKPFASFDLKRDGTAHRCQLHLGEWPWPADRPTAWDNSRGARAGLPSLGKRR
jgi:hypothetical protein